MTPKISRILVVALAIGSFLGCGLTSLTLISQQPAHAAKKSTKKKSTRRKSKRRSTRRSSKRRRSSRSRRSRRRRGRSRRRRAKPKPKPLTPAQKAAKAKRQATYGSLTAAYKLYDQGVNARLAGNNNLAISRFQQAWQKFVEHKSHQKSGNEGTLAAICQYEMGQAAEAARKYNMAADCYARCLKIRPTYVNASVRLVNMLALRGQLPRALKRAREAVQANSNEPRAHLLLALMMKKTGDLEKWKAEKATAERLLTVKARIIPKQKEPAKPGVTTKPDASKPISKPSTTKPAAGKPETAKQDATSKPASSKPETGKPTSTTKQASKTQKPAATTRPAAGGTVKSEPEKGEIIEDPVTHEKVSKDRVTRDEGDLSGLEGETRVKDLAPVPGVKQQPKELRKKTE